MSVSLRPSDPAVPTRDAALIVSAKAEKVPAAKAVTEQEDVLPPLVLEAKADLLIQAKVESLAEKCLNSNFVTQFLKIPEATRKSDASLELLSKILTLWNTLYHISISKKFEKETLLPRELFAIAHYCHTAL